GRLLDALHPQIEDAIDWYFRVSRRHEVLWFDLSFDPSIPEPALLSSRLPDGTITPWSSSPELALSQQLGQCLAQWLSARRLPQVGPLSDFTLEDVRVAADRLLKAEAQLAQGRELASVTGAMTQFPRLGVPFLRVLADLARDGARSLDPAILELDPAHP